jgi:taurine--2-oxoglutarate transaminase
MSDLPYYISWQKQNNPKTFDLKKYDGVFFHLESGEKLLDLSSTSYHTSFGGSPDVIVNKVIDALKQNPMACPKGLNNQKLKITNDLLRFMEKSHGKIYYTLSGAESVENAIKIARQVSGKKTIVARHRSYHGATLGALSATGDWRNQGSLTTTEWTLRIPEPYEDPDFSKAKQIIKDYGSEKIAAIIFEPVSAANGVIIPSEEWLKNLQKYCQEQNIFVIYDEVCTGFYRLGTKFAYQRFPGLDPDIVCLGKNISGGVFPFGAVWTSENIASHFQEEVLLCGSTNYAHPGGLGALESVIEILSDNEFVKTIAPLIKTFENGLKKLSKNPNVKEVRQIGLLAAIEFNKTIEWNDFVSNGVYCGVHGNYITLAPPYVISGKELLWGLEQIEKIIN